MDIVVSVNMLCWLGSALLPVEIDKTKLEVLSSSHKPEEKGQFPIVQSLEIAEYSAVSINLMAFDCEYEASL